MRKNEKLHNHYDGFSNGLSFQQKIINILLEISRCRTNIKRLEIYSYKCTCSLKHFHGWLEFIAKNSKTDPTQNINDAE